MEKILKRFNRIEADEFVPEEVIGIGNSSRRSRQLTVFSLNFWSQRVMFQWPAADEGLKFAMF